MDKAADAFRTISEVAEELGIQQHVLRFWETKFTQIKPLKRGGGRRYYRPDDVDLLRGIRYLLYGQGYTIKGVQRIIKEHGPKAVIAAWIELSAAEGDERAPVPMPDGVEPEALGATSEVSEQLFATVRDFSEQDDADEEQGAAQAPEHVPESPPTPKRPDFQPRPDVSIMRGGLQGRPVRPGILPLRSLAPKATSTAGSDQLDTGDEGPQQGGSPSEGHALSAADRASLAAVLEDLAACRRVLDAAGRS